MEISLSEFHLNFKQEKALENIDTQSINSNQFEVAEVLNDPGVPPLGLLDNRYILYLDKESFEKAYDTEVYRQSFNFTSLEYGKASILGLVNSQIDPDVPSLTSFQGYKRPGWKTSIGGVQA